MHHWHLANLTIGAFFMRKAFSECNRNDIRIFINVQFSRSASRARRAWKTSANGFLAVCYRWNFVFLSFCENMCTPLHHHHTCRAQAVNINPQRCIDFHWNAHCILSVLELFRCACYVHSLLCCVGGLRQGKASWGDGRGFGGNLLCEQEHFTIHLRSFKQTKANRKEKKKYK